MGNSGQFAGILDLTAARKGQDFAKKAILQNEANFLASFVENKEHSYRNRGKRPQNSTPKSPFSTSKKPNFRLTKPTSEARATAALFLLVTACTPAPHLQSDRTSAPADGASLFHLNRAATIRSGARFAHVESPTLIRAAVLPGRITLASGPSTLILTTTPLDTDSARDGTPDFLRLDTPTDQSAFRRWFTYLAEAQFFRQPLPREIDDCAALIRYSYREALSVHNDAWIAAARLPELPAIPQVAKYTYPFTPLAANLFRIRLGEYASSDPTNGAFASFADAETLLRFNAHLVSRNVDQAEPGDILFYRQIAPHMPFHTMIYLGASQLDNTPGPYVVYHTGPHGEVRRPALAELQRHPDPRWRPFPANSNFLGVYRWNILGGDRAGNQE